MGRFTNGTVRYERTVKTGDYENKKAAAEISWTADDGEADGPRNEAARVAVAQVHGMLGISTVEFKDYGDGAGPFKSAELPIEVKAAIQGVPIEEPKAEPATGLGFMKKRRVPRTAPAEVVEEPVAPVENEPETAPVVEITDDQLVKAIQAFVETTKDTVAIQKALGVFRPAGSSFKDVEQKDRKDFTDLLKALEVIEFAKREEHVAAVKAARQ